MSVRLTLKGLDRQLRQLERLGGDVRKVSEDVLLESAKMFATELVKQTNGAPMSVETKKAIMDSFVKPAIVESSDWFVVAETGFRMGDYTPDDLSGGFILTLSSESASSSIISRLAPISPAALTASSSSKAG